MRYGARMRKLVGLILVALVVSAAHAQPASTQGAWVVMRDVDAFTDEVTMWAFVTAVDRGTFAPETMLAVFCDDGPGAINGVGVIVSDTESMIEKRVEVTYRVDAKPAVTATWSAGASSVAPFFEAATAFLAELVGGEVLLLRVPAWLSTPTYEFRVAGFADVMRELACYTGPL